MGANHVIGFSSSRIAALSGRDAVSVEWAMRHRNGGQPVRQLQLTLETVNFIKASGSDRLHPRVRH
jgi:hypothetical protein